MGIKIAGWQLIERLSSPARATSNVPIVVLLDEFTEVAHFFILVVVEVVAQGVAIADLEEVIIQALFGDFKVLRRLLHGYVGLAFAAPLMDLFDNEADLALLRAVVDLELGQAELLLEEQGQEGSAALLEPDDEAGLPPVILGRQIRVRGHRLPPEVHEQPRTQPDQQVGICQYYYFRWGSSASPGRSAPSPQSSAPPPPARPA
jgi:hypothetical protein